MSNEPTPLKYMGTQSQETVNLAAAMADDAIRARERAADRAMGFYDDVDVASHDAAAAGSRIGDAADWALAKTKETLHAAAGQVRERAATVVSTYTRKDPVRAVLLAAGTGAFLMVLLAMTARSGARKVRRRIER